MSIYKSSSLAMIPTAYKDGKLYSVRPTDGSGDFTFSRGSNLAATRVDVNGLIEKGRENVLLQSNQFDTTWNLTNGSSVTSGQSGYDGTNDAWLLTDSGYAGSYALYEGISNVGVLTASIYAKSASTNVVELDLFGSPSPFVQVNLTTGSITNASNHIDAQSVSVGNGWWRISVTSNLSSTSYIRVGCDGAGSIYIQDAQLEQGLVATDYIETTTTSVSAGILEDMPRLDYSGSCPSLLLEPQRTNLIKFSEYFEASEWTYYNSTISSNNSTSPDGFENATRWTSTASGTFLTESLFVSDPSNFSVFVKYVDHPYILLYSGASGGYSAAFDIQNNITGTLGAGTSNAKIESYGNGWYRISCTFSGASAGSSARIGFANSLTSTWGDLNLSAAGDVLIYGTQFEAGSYPTSYIPTYGTSQTRSGDDCAVNYTEISDTSGTIFWQGFVDIGADSHAIALSNSANAGGSNRILLYRSTSDNKVWLYIQSAGVSVKNISLQVPTDSNDKYAVSWATNDFAVYINGTQIYTSSSGAIPTSMQYIQLNEWSSIHAETNLTKQALYFPTRLTNAELAALTTL